MFSAYRASLVLFKVFLILFAWTQGVNAASVQNVTSKTEISYANITTDILQLEAFFAQDVRTLVIKNISNEVLADPIKIYPNVSASSAVQILGADGDDGESGGLYYNLLSKTGKSQLLPGDVAQFEIEFRYNDYGQIELSPTVTANVLPVASTPVFLTEPQLSAYVGVDYQYVINVDSGSADPIVDVSLTQHPAGIELLDQNIITWVPGASQVGMHAITVLATNSEGLSENQAFELQVQEPNLPPVITSAAPESALVDQLYSYQIVAVDPNSNDTISYFLNSGPDTMAVSDTGLVTWQPSQPGDYAVSLLVKDASGEPAIQNFTVTVEQAPSSAVVSFVSIPGQSVQVGDSYTYQALASTSGTSELTFSVEVGPLELTIDHQTGLVEWSPKIEDVGANPVVIKAFDKDGNVAEQPFSIQVIEGLSAPKIVSVPPLSVLEGREYEYLVDVNPDSSEYSYLLRSSSSQASLDSFGRLRWSHEDGLAGSVTSQNEFCTAPYNDPGLFDPVLKWHWQGGQVRITPLVAQLNDDNNDGLITTSDTPDVIFTAYNDKAYSQAWMVALDGKTGTPIASFEQPVERFHAYTHLALGDIDNDGIVEIVTLSEKTVVAYDHTGGAPKWVAERPYNLGVRATPVIADLDADGSPEIVISKFVFSATGDLLWVGEGDSQGGAWRCDCDHTITLHGANSEFTSIAYDFIDSSPGQEVIVGNQVYSASGELLWTAEELGDGFPAVADLDGDGKPELVIQDHRNWQIGAVDQSGKLLWKSDVAASAAGPVTLSDINGDGKVEIGFVDKRHYFVISHDGELLWEADVDDASSGVTGSTVFDFEGDGKADIVYFDEEYLRVFDEFGNVKFQIENNSGTWVEYPVIADIDNDGHADIVIPSSDSRDVIGGDNQTKGVRAFQDRYNTWPATRSIWNQHAYHIDNVNDDGSIPRVPAKSYLTHNTFRLSAFSNRAGQEQMDLVLDKVRLESHSAAKQLVVDLVNRTPMNLPDIISVAFYHGEPSHGELLGQVAINGIYASQTKPVVLENVSTDNWQENIYVTFETNGETPECISDNNQAIATYFNIKVADQRGRGVAQEFLVNVLNHNVAPKITSVAPTSAVAGNEYVYDLDAQDQDLGDKLKYLLIQAPDGMQIEPVVGKITWSPTNQQVGNNDVTVGVVDTSGSVVEQHFTIEVLENVVENRPPYFTNIKTFYTHKAGDFISIVLESIDPDGDNVTYELLDASDGITHYGAYTLFFTHTYNDVDLAPGLYTAKVKVTDEHGLYSVAVIPIWLTEEKLDQTSINDGTLSPPQYVVEDKEIVFLVGATNYYALPMPDTADDYYYQRVTGPWFLKVENNTIIWKPGFIGDYTARVRLTNGVFSYEYDVQISVRRSDNVAPVLTTSGFPSIHYVNEPFEYQFEYSDPNDDPVTFNVVSKPSIASIDETGLFSWTPTTNEIGSQQIVISLSDSTGLMSTTTLNFEVKEFRNRTPKFTQASPPHFAVVGGSYEYQFLATDEDGDDLTFSVSNGPSGAVIDSTGKLTINNISLVDIGDYEMEVKAEDPAGAFETITYNLYVAQNTAPVFTTMPGKVAHIGKTYWYGPRAEDKEGHSFSFGLVNGPDNLVFNESSGEIKWSPTEDQQGDQQIQISVTDQFGKTAYQTINVYVYSDQIMDRNVCPAPAAYQ